MLEAGEYIAKNFFNDDPKLYHDQSPKKAEKGANLSFIVLCDKLKGEDPAAPSRTWLTNAVRIYFDRKYLSENDEETCHTYDKLTASHWAVLTSKAAAKEKSKYIQLAYDKKLSVRELTELIKGQTEKDEKSTDVFLAKFKKSLTQNMGNLKKIKGIKGTKKAAEIDTAYQEFLAKIQDIVVDQ